MEKLISNTQFGFYLRGKEINPYKYTELRENYDTFLSQKLSLDMFVPCKLVEGVWVVLEKPDGYEDWYKWGSFSYSEDPVIQKCSDYLKCFKRVLFDGFEIKEYSGKLLSVESNGVSVFFKIPSKEWYTPNGFETIENLVKDGFTLTPTAQKQIGL